MNRHLENYKNMLTELKDDLEEDTRILACKTDGNASFLRAARSGNVEKIIEYLKGNIDINTSNANGLNALHLAAKEGHVNVVTELLKRGANVNAATKKGNTALHIASLAGQEEIVRVLIQLGANVNVQSQNGFTPLYMAAQENHDSVVSFLLANGANQSLATEDGFTPLAVALQQGHDKVVAVLLENDTKGKVRLPALHIAAKKDDCKAATLLLQSDHNPDVTSKSGFTPLHIAAHYGNENIAKILLSKGADVNYAAKHQITPLHVASKWGKTNMVVLLLENGANIEASTRDGLTPLHCAARSGHDQVVDLLLEKGAPFLAKTKNGLAPLHMASQGDHVDSARILLYHKAPVDDVTVDYLTALHVAAHCGHVKVAKLLLDRKADPNARALNGFTPLHIACKKNRIKVVELLWKHGASIEATTESGLTPLHVASFMGCMNIVIYLIQNGSNPDVPTVRGETPLHLAARANQTDIIRILLRNGASVDARAREEQTPLHIASRLGNVDIVSLLLQHGAAVDATTKDMYTALHIAAKEDQEEVASHLLDHGASLTATTKKGFTPLHLAAKYGNIKVARLLLQKGALVDAQGKNGVTPLHVASHYDHVNVALLLLEKGASPHAMAKNGYTPLHIAAKKNQMDIASTLIEYGANANAESKAGFTPLHLASQEGHTDMAMLLIDHKAKVNHKANNGLTPLHLCAQDDQVNVAIILVDRGAEIGPQTKAGYTPLHVASHFGQINMVRFLIQNKADIHTTTSHGYTALHQAAQQGHTLVVNHLLENEASPNVTTMQGQTPLAIAQRLGYISVVETLKVVTETTVTTTTTTVTEEKYKVVAPETMQETFMTDSEDEGGEEAMLGDQSYRYLTADEMKSLGDDSLPIDVTKDEKHHDVMHSVKQFGAPMVEEDKLSPQHGTPVEGGFSEKFSPDNVDLARVPVHAGRLKWKTFLVSFMVDARGGAMRGCRHSGVRVIIPPRKASMPMRITCRYLRKEKLIHPPPLMEGEACASRILEMGPVGARFLGPVIIEVPHFAATRGKEREITILRSDTGETWREHTLEASEEAVQEVLNESFEGEELSALEDLNTNRITRILTTDFPQYFAIVTRVRQEVHGVGPDGGMVSSTVVPQVQAIFPEGALTKKIRVGLQAQPIAPELVAKLLGNRVAVSPIVTVEPRRRKFHKPITLTIPVPQAATKGMINQYSGDAPTLRLLCSITGSTKSGGSSKAQWEDVTGSTPLTFVNDCVSFTTTVSARFWLMDCRQVNEVTRYATELYQEAVYVPFMSKFVIFAKRYEPYEAQLRVFCMTDDKEDKTLECQENFTEVAKSRDVEVLEGKLQYLEFAGNLAPVTKSGEQLKLDFQAFHENRLPFTIRVKDPHMEPMGRMAFMREPKAPRGEPPQVPICNLNVALPEVYMPESSPHHVELVTLEKKYDFMEESGLSKPEVIHRADLRLSDIARELDKDWILLAQQLDLSENDTAQINTAEECDEAEKALMMMRLWLQKSGSKATGNELEKGLRKINREDIIKNCMFNVELVTDDVEKAVAKVHLDQSGFDVFKEELGSSREASMRRGASLDASYDEQDIMKEAESAAETSSETGSLFERDQLSHAFTDDKVNSDLKEECSNLSPAEDLDEIFPKCKISNNEKHNNLNNSDIAQSQEVNFNPVVSSQNFENMIMDDSNVVKNGNINITLHEVQNDVRMHEFWPPDKVATTQTIVITSNLEEEPQSSQPNNLSDKSKEVLCTSSVMLVQNISKSNDSCVINSNESTVNVNPGPDFSVIDSNNLNTSECTILKSTSPDLGYHSLNKDNINHTEINDNLVQPSMILLSYEQGNKRTHSDENKVSNTYDTLNEQLTVETDISSFNDNGEPCQLSKQVETVHPASQIESNLLDITKNYCLQNELPVTICASELPCDNSSEENKLLEDARIRRASKTPPPSPVDEIYKDEVGERLKENILPLAPIKTEIKEEVSEAVAAQDLVVKLTESETWPSLEMDTSQVSISSLPDDEKSEITTAVIPLDIERSTEIKSPDEKTEETILSSNIIQTTHMTFSLQEEPLTGDIQTSERFEKKSSPTSPELSFAEKRDFFQKLSLSSSSTVTPPHTIKSSLENETFIETESKIDTFASEDSHFSESPEEQLSFKERLEFFEKSSEPPITKPEIKDIKKEVWTVISDISEPACDSLAIDEGLDSEKEREIETIEISERRKSTVSIDSQVSLPLYESKEVSETVFDSSKDAKVELVVKTFVPGSEMLEICSLENINPTDRSATINTVEIKEITQPEILRDLKDISETSSNTDIRLEKEPERSDSKPSKFDDCNDEKPLTSSLEENILTHEEFISKTYQTEVETTYDESKYTVEAFKKETSDKESKSQKDSHDITPTDQSATINSIEIKEISHPETLKDLRDIYENSSNADINLVKEPEKSDSKSSKFDICDKPVTSSLAESILGDEEFISEAYQTVVETTYEGSKSTVEEFKKEVSDEENKRQGESHDIIPTDRSATIDGIEIKEISQPETLRDLRDIYENSSNADIKLEKKPERSDSKPSTFDDINDDKPITSSSAENILSDEEFISKTFQTMVETTYDASKSTVDAFKKETSDKENKWQRESPDNINIVKNTMEPSLGKSEIFICTGETLDNVKKILSVADAESNVMVFENETTDTVTTTDKATPIKTEKDMFICSENTAKEVKNIMKLVEEDMQQFSEDVSTTDIKIKTDIIKEKYTDQDTTDEIIFVKCVSQSLQTQKTASDISVQADSITNILKETELPVQSLEAEKQDDKKIEFSAVDSTLNAIKSTKQKEKSPESCLSDNLVNAKELPKSTAEINEDTTDEAIFAKCVSQSLHTQKTDSDISVQTDSITNLLKETELPIQSLEAEKQDKKIEFSAVDSTLNAIKSTKQKEKSPESCLSDNLINTKELPKSTAKINQDTTDEAIFAKCVSQSLQTQKTDSDISVQADSITNLLKETELPVQSLEDEKQDDKKIEFSAVDSKLNAIKSTKQKEKSPESCLSDIQIKATELPKSTTEINQIAKESFDENVKVQILAEDNLDFIKNVESEMEEYALSSETKTFSTVIPISELTVEEVVEINKDSKLTFITTEKVESLISTENAGEKDQLEHSKYSAVHQITSQTSEGHLESIKTIDSKISECVILKKPLHTTLFDSKENLKSEEHDFPLQSTNLSGQGVGLKLDLGKCIDFDETLDQQKSSKKLNKKCSEKSDNTSSILDSKTSSHEIRSVDSIEDKSDSCFSSLKDQSVDIEFLPVLEISDDIVNIAVSRTGHDALGTPCSFHQDMIFDDKQSDKTESKEHELLECKAQIEEESPIKEEKAEFEAVEKITGANLEELMYKESIRGRSQKETVESVEVMQIKNQTTEIYNPSEKLIEKFSKKMQIQSSFESKEKAYPQKMNQFLDSVTQQEEGGLPLPLELAPVLKRTEEWLDQSGQILMKEGCMLDSEDNGLFEDRPPTLDDEHHKRSSPTAESFDDKARVEQCDTDVMMQLLDFVSRNEVELSEVRTEDEAPDIEEDVSPSAEEEEHRIEDLKELSEKVEKSHECLKVIESENLLLSPQRSSFDSVTSPSRKEFHSDIGETVIEMDAQQIIQTSGIKSKVYPQSSLEVEVGSHESEEFLGGEPDFETVPLSFVEEEDQSKLDSDKAVKKTTTYQDNLTEKASSTAIKSEITVAVLADKAEDKSLDKDDAIEQTAKTFEQTTLLAEEQTESKTSDPKDSMPFDKIDIPTEQTDELGKIEEKQTKICTDNIGVTKHEDHSTVIVSDKGENKDLPMHDQKLEMESQLRHKQSVTDSELDPELVLKSKSEPFEESDSNFVPCAFVNTAFAGAELIDEFEQSTPNRSRSPYEVVREEQHESLKTISQVEQEITNFSNNVIRTTYISRTIESKRKPLLQHIPSEISEEDLVEKEMSSPITKEDFDAFVLPPNFESSDLKVKEVSNEECPEFGVSECTTETTHTLDTSTIDSQTSKEQTISHKVTKTFVITTESGKDSKIETVETESDTGVASSPFEIISESELSDRDTRSGTLPLSLTMPKSDEVDKSPDSVIMSISQSFTDKTISADISHKSESVTLDKDLCIKEKSNLTSLDSMLANSFITQSKKSDSCIINGPGEVEYRPDYDISDEYPLYKSPKQMYTHENSFHGGKHLSEGTDLEGIKNNRCSSVSDDFVDAEIGEILKSDQVMEDIIERPVTPEPPIDEFSNIGFINRHTEDRQTESFVELSEPEISKSTKYLSEDEDKAISSPPLTPEDLKMGFAYGMQFEKEVLDLPEEAMDIDSDQFSEEKDLAYAYSMRFEQDPELEDDIPCYGDLYTHEEVDEDALENGDKIKLVPKNKDLDFDILAGRKYFTKNVDVDEMSTSSLQEFERLEAEIVSGRKSSIGSIESLNGKLPTSKSGDHDDVSMSSLTEFEKLEKECIETDKIPPEMQESITQLSEIEEGHESQASEASQENKSDAGKDEDLSIAEAYDNQLDNIEEIILKTETEIKDELPFQYLIKQAQKPSDAYVDKSMLSHKTSEITKFSNVETHISFIHSNKVSLKLTDCSSKEDRTEDIDQDSLHEELSLKPDSLVEDMKREYHDSLHESKCDDADSLQGDEMRDSLFEDKHFEDDSLHEMDILPDESSLSLESSLAAAMSHDSSRTDDQLKTKFSDEPGPLKQFSFNVKGEKTEIVISELPKCDIMLSSTDSLEQSSSAVAAAFHNESESIMSTSLTSALMSEDNTMISSTDTLEHEGRITFRYEDIPVDELEILVKDGRKVIVDSEGNIQTEYNVEHFLASDDNINGINVCSKDKIGTELPTTNVHVHTTMTAMSYTNQPKELECIKYTSDQSKNESDRTYEFTETEPEVEEIHTTDEFGNPISIRRMKKIIQSKTQFSSSSSSDNVEEKLKDFLREHAAGETAGVGEEEVKEERLFDEKGNIVLVRTVEQKMLTEPEVHSKTFTGPDADALSHEFIKKFKSFDPTDDVTEFEKIDEQGNVVRVTQQVIIKPEVHSISFSGPNAHQQMEEYMKQWTSHNSGDLPNFSSGIKVTSSTEQSQVPSGDSAKDFPCTSESAKLSETAAPHTTEKIETHITSTSSSQSSFDHKDKHLSDSKQTTTE